MSAQVDQAFFGACRARIARAESMVAQGQVRSLVGNVIEAEGLCPEVGALCELEPSEQQDTVIAEVIGFRDDRFLMMPLRNADGVAPGAAVRQLAHGPGVPLAESSLGRVINGLGQPIDGGPPLDSPHCFALESPAEASLLRRRIEEPLDLGVRAINGLLTAARGARIGLFAGSGVGKSTLLGQIARSTNADVNVVALIGERGREVREFVERELGDALARSVVVVATSDEAPLLRRRTALLATALAEQFRDAGRHALLLMDSVTRFCTAQREIGLAAGEPPATRGYPPSLWSVLPRLLERAGTGAGSGSVTGIYTVLVEGDDLNEPVSDALRALLDGHVVLSREIASRGQYPAIDVLASVSRLMSEVASPEHLAAATRARQALATYRDAEDLISIGAYVAGSNSAIDEARSLAGPLRSFLQQRPDEFASLGESIAALDAALSATRAPEIVS